MSNVREDSIIVLASFDKVWFDSESLVNYLRGVEMWAEEHGGHDTALVVRRVADGLILTSLVAGEEVRTRRESR